MNEKIKPTFYHPLHKVYANRPIAEKDEMDRQARQQLFLEARAAFQLATPGSWLPEQSDHHRVYSCENSSFEVMLGEIRLQYAQIKIPQHLIETMHITKNGIQYSLTGVDSWLENMITSPESEEAIDKSNFELNRSAVLDLVEEIRSEEIKLEQGW